MFFLCIKTLKTPLSSTKKKQPTWLKQNADIQIFFGKLTFGPPCSMSLIIIKKLQTGILFSSAYCQDIVEIWSENIRQSTRKRRIMSTVKNTMKGYQKRRQNIHQAEIYRTSACTNTKFFGFWVLDIALGFGIWEIWGLDSFRVSFWSLGFGLL
jgi:hypothetical protein